MMQNAITVSNISKLYKIYNSPRDRLKEALSIGNHIYHNEFWALRNVSFNVKLGSTIGILGVNGSGKSTLLKIISGFLAPTAGNVKTKGTLSAILELGTGFNKDFSGRNNVKLYCSLMGMSKEQIQAKMPFIEEFAELGDFFDRPARLYSSGMFMRLAFACTIHVDPKILIIDEALAVGDAAFQHKCVHRLKQIQEQGVTILFVSHSIGAVKSLCQEAILLERGRIIHSGNAEDVANFYHDHLSLREQKKRVRQKKNTRKKTDQSNLVQIAKAQPVKKHNRVGTGEIRIESVCLYDMDDRVLENVPFNEKVRLAIKLITYKKCRPAVVGYQIRDRHGIELLGTNTAVEQTPLPKLEAGEECVVNFLMHLPLLQGTYSITAAVGHGADDAVYYDWWDVAATFEILPPTNRKLTNNKVHLPVSIDIDVLQERKRYVS